MTRYAIDWLCLLACCALLINAGCDKGKKSDEEEQDTQPFVPSDDTDSDADTDTESATVSGGDTDTVSDTGAKTDTGSDTGRDSGGEIDAGSDTGREINPYFEIDTESDEMPPLVMPRTDNSSGPSDLS